MDLLAKDRRARRRAKLALVATYLLRNGELSRFSGIAITDLARAGCWKEARRIISFRRAEANIEEGSKGLAGEWFRRYEGVTGTDFDGRALDERGFDETK